MGDAWSEVGDAWSDVDAMQERFNQMDSLESEEVAMSETMRTVPEESLVVDETYGLTFVDDPAAEFIVDLEDDAFVEVDVEPEPEEVLLNVGLKFLDLAFLAIEEVIKVVVDFLPVASDIVVTASKRSLLAINPNATFTATNRKLSNLQLQAKEDE